MKRKIIIICACIFVVILSIICILRSLNLPNAKDVYTYTVNSNMNYDVYLNENNFMNISKLGENSLYISDLVKYIKINFDYKFNGSNSSNLNYTYNIFATLNIDYSSNTSLSNLNLYSKKYDLISHKYLELSDTDNFNVSDSVSIDYNFYNNEVKKFKEQFSNIPIKAYLVVEFVINSDISLPKSTNSNQADSMSLKFDLNQPVFGISKSYNEEKSNNIPKAGVNNSNIDKPQFIIGIILLSISIVLFFTIIKKYSKSYYSSNYKLTLYKILKNNKNIIVRTNSKIDESNLIVVDLVELDDLLDIENELKIPIVFFEIDGEAVFVIVNSNIEYKYILKE